MRSTGNRPKILSLKNIVTAAGAAFVLFGTVGLAGCTPEPTTERGQIPMLGTDTGGIVTASPNGGSETTGVTNMEVVIGSCSALEGRAKFLGTQTVTGAKAYINSINDAGGIYGRKIKLITLNDSYDPDRAIDCFGDLMKQGIFAAAFFVGTPTAAKYVPMAEANKIPLVGLFTGAQLLHEPFRPHVISVRASYYDEAREQITHMWNDLAMKRIGVIYQDDAFGAAVLSGVKAALETHNSAPVALGSFSRNSLEVDEAIRHVRDAKPDAVILVGTYGSLAEIVKRSHADGWHPLFTTVSFVGTEAFIKDAGADADGTVITQVVPPYNLDTLPTVVLYKKLLKQYFPNETPNFTSFEGFVDAMVVVDGLRRAGRNLTRSNFISAIESIRDQDIGLGRLKLNYGPQRHKGFESVYFTVVRNGQPISFTDWHKATSERLDLR